LIETQFSPFELLEKTQKIEKKMGRKTKTIQNYSDRIIDIDILFYDDLIINTPELKIPHPLWKERDFVRIPFLEISEQ
jgi:2-amino-4-hydroxy-6-hydroxymethyldihydropteridine diphosphokinase